MKLLCLPLVVLLFLVPVTSSAEPIDNIIALLKQGNTTKLSKLFADNIEVTIISDDNSYTKADASPALDKFFAENKPQSAKLFHKINSNPKYLFAVIFLNTDKGVYRVSLTLNKVGADMKIIELRIENEKTK